MDQINAASDGLLSRLATLHTVFSAGARRVIRAAAQLDRAAAAPDAQGAAGLVDACRVLDRVAELPALAPRRVRSPSHADVVAQADALNSVAAQLSTLLRRGQCADGAEAGAVGRGAVGRADLGPNETRASLILAAETMSLSARLCLALARLGQRPGCLRRELFTSVVPGMRWVFRVAASTVSIDVGHLWPVVLAGVAGVAVTFGWSVAHRAACRATVRVVADVVGLLTTPVAPHLVVLVVALVDALTTQRFAYLTRHLRAGRADEARPRAVGFDSPAPRSPRTRTRTPRTVARAPRVGRLSCRIRRVTG
ncbi:MAG TPA: hypothetical protein VHX38_11620 [Pseudonocardiaceae bacterium]|nr:hypothetical protein [Pseudonocardiaceae bacterium]